MCPVGAEVLKDSRRPKLNVNRQAMRLMAVLTITTVAHFATLYSKQKQIQDHDYDQSPIPSYHSRFFHRSSGFESKYVA